MIIPVTRIHQNLMKGYYAKHIQAGSAVYLAGVLEYLVAEISDIAVTEAMNAKRQRITPRHIMLAIRKDSDVDELLKDVTISEAGVLPTVNPR